MDKLIKLDPNSLLCAGPTTGKTFLARQLGDLIVDTDRIIEKLLPEYYSERVYADKSKPAQVAGKARDYAVSYYLLDSEDKPIITNLWSPTFLNTLLGSGKPKLYFFRNNARRMVELSEDRKGTDLDFQLVTNWLDKAKSFAGKAFERVIWLNDDEYLSDYISLEGKHWILKNK